MARWRAFWRQSGQKSSGSIHQKNGKNPGRMPQRAPGAASNSPAAKQFMNRRPRRHGGLADRTKAVSCRRRRYHGPGRQPGKDHLFSAPLGSLAVFAHCGHFLPRFAATRLRSVGQQNCLIRSRALATRFGRLVGAAVWFRRGAKPGSTAALGTFVAVARAATTGLGCSEQRGPQQGHYQQCCDNATCHHWKHGLIAQSLTTRTVLIVDQSNRQSQASLPWRRENLILVIRCPIEPALRSPRQ